MVCGKALETLVAVAITGKVDVSTFQASKNMTINAGDSVTMKFLADPTVMYRFAEGNYVKDGIGPYPICEEEFSISIGTKVLGHLGMAPPTYEGLPGSFYFSLMQGRPVRDGAWVSQDPVDPMAGFPLKLHGQGPGSKFGGTFALDYARHTIPTTDLTSASGTYGTKGLVKATMDLWNGWSANTVATIKFDSMTVSNPL